VGLLDLHAKLQEVKRLAAAVRLVTPQAPVGADEPADGPVLAGGPGASSHLDQAA
jgi:hypothetical protein